MTYAANDFDTLRPIPSWVTSVRPETAEDVAFLSGSVLNHLHLVVSDTSVPHPLLRDRLALWAAEEAMKRFGRPERGSNLRDEVHLSRPGDTLGPAGQEFARWRAFAQGRLAKPRGRLAPLAETALVLEMSLASEQGDETEALMAADRALAQSVGWAYPLPLLCWGLHPRHLHLSGPALQNACHKAVLQAGPKVVAIARDLARRAERLRRIAPKLRAKGAGAALKLFLTEDALSPAIALSPVVRGSTAQMSDRAARRLCDRLVALGVVQEFTGRDMFRLYGV